MPGPLLLYAEDDPNDVFLVQRAFLISRPDLQLRIVQDGQAAIDYLSSALSPGGSPSSIIPSLLLLDISMPGRDGFDVLAWVRSRPQLSRMPVIMISSSDSTQDQQKAAILGANYFIPKTPACRDLPDLVQPWLTA